MAQVLGATVVWADRDFNTVGTANENRPLYPRGYEAAAHAHDLCSHSQLSAGCRRGRSVIFTDATQTLCHIYLFSKSSQNTV